MRKRATGIVTLTSCLILVLFLIPGVTACSSEIVTETVTATNTMTTTATPPATTATTEEVLTITKGTESESLTMEDLKALTTIEAEGYFMNSVGEILGPFSVKGTPIMELCDLVGGLDSNNAIRVIAKDGYSMTISYDKIVNSDFTTFDCSTGEEIEDGELDVLLAYEEGGQPIDPVSDGPLRLMVMGEPNQVTEGHWWVKWVTSIEIIDIEEPWTLHLEGAISKDIDPGTFESCAAPGCHGATWVDNQGRTYEGVPLWWLLGSVDDEIEHDSDVAFNDDLADIGYEVQVIAADGYTVTFDIQDVRGNNDIIVAYKLDGEPLEEDRWPLRLVGPDLDGSQKVGQIIEIRIVFP